MNAQNIEYNSATPKGLVHENTLGSAAHRTRQTCGIFLPVFGRGEQTGNACCLAEPRFSTPRPPVILEKVTGGTSDSFRSTIMAKSISSGTSAHQDSASKIVDRFMAKVVKTEGCWNWTARKTPQGYGRISVGNVNKLAHRVAFELMVGPIGELHVLHRCDNPSCVNPAHLWLGTNAENVADKVAKGRVPSVVGAANPKSKLQDEDVLAIREAVARGIKQRDLAAQYGVTQTQICTIAHRKQWRHL